MAYGSSAFGSEAYGSSSNVISLGVITYFLGGHLSKANITITFTLNARIVSRPEKIFTLDTKVVLRNTKTFTLNASLQKTFTKTFTINGLPLKIGITKSFAIDSRLIFRREKTFTLNASLQKTFTKTFTIGARAYASMGWLSPWKHRKKLNIIGGTVVATNFVLQLTVHKGSGTDSSFDIYCNNYIKNDFTDLRFTDSNGKRLIRYQIVSVISGISAVVNVEIPYIPTSPDYHNIYIYYGNSSASSIGVSLTYSTSNLVKIINLNDAVPVGDTGTSCGIFLEQTYTDLIPNFKEAWVAQKGFDTYTDIVTNGSSNGIAADDIWSLKINENQIFAVYILTTISCPLFPVTDVLGTVPPYISKNISANLSALVGNYIDFKVQLVNTLGVVYSATSGAVYIFGSSVSELTLAWGNQENLGIFVIKSHRVGIRIING